MTTVLEIIDEVRANVNEDSTVTEKFYTQEEMINYIKRSINDICIDTDSNYYIYELDIVGSSVGTATSINASSTVNFYLATHGLKTRDYVYISGLTGTISGLVEDTYREITVVDANNFTIADDGSSYTAVSGTITKMPKTYLFTSVSASTTIHMADLKFMSYRSDDWQEWIYEDLPVTSPKANVSGSTSLTRRQTCIVYNDAIHLSKGPEIGDKILVAGRWLPTAITTSGDTYPLGAVEEDATISYATSKAWLKKNKIDIATAWMSLYQERKKDIMDKRARMVKITFPSTLSISKTTDYYKYGMDMITT